MIINDISIIWDGNLEDLKSLPKHSGKLETNIDGTELILTTPYWRTGVAFEKIYFGDRLSVVHGQLIIERKVFN